MCLLPPLSLAEMVFCFLSKVQCTFMLNMHRKYAFFWEEGSHEEGWLNFQSGKEEGLKIDPITAIYYLSYS